MRRSLLIVLKLLCFCSLANAQQNIRDYVLFGGNNAVQLNSSTSVSSGSVGSYSLVKTTGSSVLGGNLHSGGRIELANSNTVAGNITAANSASLTGTILQVGSNTNLKGKVDVKGNIVIGSGLVTGPVTYATGSTYSGPKPTGGAFSGTPVLPQLPALPAITTFTNAGTVNVVNTQKVFPETPYNNLALTGNKTVTFSGTGVYTFNSIKLSGNFNNFVFDFGGSATGIIRIYVHGDVDLYKLNVSFLNGGDASRVFMEVHGTGATAPDKVSAWSISNGASGNNRSAWYGTVWAPNGSVNVGQGSSEAKIVGALWSGKSVTVQSGVSVSYMPLINDEVIIPFNPTKGKVSTIIGAELASLTEGISEEAKKVMVILDGYVLIDVIAKQGHEAEVVSYLLSEGMTGIISNGANTLITTGKFPIANLLHLNSRGDIINFCRPVFTPIGNSGLIKNAGDTAIGTQLVRNGYNLQGLGVKIGVISDSYNSQVTSSSNPAQLDVSTGELPGAGNPVNTTPVQVLLDYPYGSRSDEGRAMLQIIHDIAPKAELTFRTGFISPGDFAVGIKQMQEAGCQVIVDDITFINEPFLQDGPVAKMVDVVKGLGVTYFTSAGNFSNKSHEQNYRPVAAPAGFPAGTTAHDFNGSGDIYQRIRLKPGSYTIVLQWEDDIYSIGQTQSGGTKNDFDLYLTDVSGNIICGYNRDNTFGDPFEFLAYTVSNNVTEVDANILITRANAGTPNPRFKYIIFRGDAVIAEYQSGASTIVGQANAAGAITVGAINYYKTPAFTTAPPVIAPYSSVGGTLIGTVDRHKPDVTAPDGVNTSVNMGPDYAGDADPFSNFFGTSAAAPHAAATAALLIEGRKRFLDEVLTPDGVKSLLQSTALNIGPSNAAGAGLIQADVAMRTFASPTPFLISLDYPSTITPTNLPTSSFTLTVNGDYLTDGSQVLFRGEAVPTTYVSNTQLTAIIPAFTGNPSIQVYTPPIANGDGGYSNTIQFFSIAKKIITVTADAKTKKYGEQLPAFTSSILVGGVPLAQSGLTLQNIGLQNLSYATNATPLSNVGNQYFIKPVRPFDLTNATDVGLLELYTYDTIPGILTIEKLPVKVIPNDQTITYGQDLVPITFRYEVDPAIAAANPQVVNIIKLSHEEFLAPNVIGLVNRLPVAISNGALPVAISNGFPVAISNGFPVAISNGVELPLYNAQSVTGFDIGSATVVPYTLTAQELANLSFYASEKSLASTRQVTPNMTVVDIAQESVLGYNSNPSLTYMVNTVEPTKAKGILGAEPLSNGALPVAISNRSLPVAISNAFPVAISNGALPVAISNALPIAISNGALPIAISNSFNEQAHRIAVIIDQTDVSDQTGVVLRALNVVTGLTAGLQSIIPGSVLNDNYEITYGLGKLTVNPASVTIKANDATKLYGEPSPTFTATYSGLKYGETVETSDIKGTPLLTTNAVETSPVGSYDIAVNAANVSSANYTITTAKGTLTILNNPCFITHSPFSSFGSTPKPNAPTSLWLNIEIKMSGQLSAKGDYLSFSAGAITLNNITSNPAVLNTAIPKGIIIADNVAAPITSFDLVTNTWITKVPVGFSSTSDIFISGAIIQSSNGFAKNNNASSVVKGIFNSNKPFSGQWSYAMATYRPQFQYADISQPGAVSSVNGTYHAGTPTTQIRNLVSGGTSGGGNNYSGSSSSYENFTACLVGNAVTVKSRSALKQTEITEEDLGKGLTVVPNPAASNITVSFVPSVSGHSTVAIYNINGTLVSEVYSGLSEQGKTYYKRIDVSKLAGGLYVIQFRNGNTLEFKKLVIAR